MAERDLKEDAVHSAKAFLSGLKNRPRQPWDDLAEDREEAPAPPVPPRPAATSSASEPDPWQQATRIAGRNADIAKRTRHLRKD